MQFFSHVESFRSSSSRRSIGLIVGMNREYKLKKYEINDRYELTANSQVYVIVTCDLWPVLCYGAFFLSKFNLLVVFTYDLRFSNSILLLFSIGIRFSTSTFVLFDLDFPFVSSTIFLSKRNVRYLSLTFVFFKRDVRVLTSIFTQA